MKKKLLCLIVVISITFGMTAQCFALDFDKDSDVDIGWGSVDVYLSHECIEDLRRNPVLIGAGITSSAGLTGSAATAMASVVLTSTELGSLAGPIGGIVGGSVALFIAYNLFEIFRLDDGNGVYITGWIQPYSHAPVYYIFSR